MQWDQEDPCTTTLYKRQDEAMVLSLQTFNAVQMDFKKAVKNMRFFKEFDYSFGQKLV